MAINFGDIFTGVGAVAGAAASLDAAKQQEKGRKEASKLAKKGIKIIEAVKEYDGITGGDIDKITKQNIDATAANLKALEPVVQAENVFNIEEARKMNQFIRENLALYLPGYQELLENTSKVIDANLRGDMTEAEKAGVLESQRTAMAQTGASGGVADTAEMLGFFGIRRNLMNTGVSQFRGAQMDARNLADIPTRTTRADFAGFGTITAAQRLSVEQSERLNEYKSRLEKATLLANQYSNAASVRVGAAASPSALGSALAAIGTLATGAGEIAGRIESRRLYQDELNLRRQQLANERAIIESRRNALGL